MDNTRCRERNMTPTMIVRLAIPVRMERDLAR